MAKIILFDGECHLCCYSVQFVTKRDLKGIYKFAALKSKSGKTIRQAYGIPHHITSVVLISGRTYYTKSSAILRIARHLHGLWKLASLLLIIPKPIRDRLYDLFAKNRYKFTRKTRCFIPSDDMSKRIL
ncbi:MAG TPA: DCC1-like thiol-disulfide oxidoreductase family protein [Bacillota bacterium]|nr:DCC1-like thiol-disulfide oxidoreductase family protein [Bacillota bacterium]